MATYKIRFQPSAEKDLRHLPSQIFKRVFAKIEELGGNPLPVGCKKLKAADSTYRIRIGDYRVVYDLNKDDRSITIHYIRHRSEAYK